MANIINIETTATRCSVALGVEGQVEAQWEDQTPHNAAKKLAGFVEACLDVAARKELKIDAVAVSLGPGSYTGLRIGLSFAKGFCFSRSIPLIGIPTLKLLAVKGMFMNREFTGEELFVPMIDARRMEVYTSAYDFHLNEVSEACSMILDADSYKDLAAERELYFIGDGSAKGKGVLPFPEERWLSADEPHAVNMAILAEKAYREEDFLDPAYSVPIYVKEYEAKKSVNKVLRNN